MSKVVTGASVSLDGYISGPQETGFDHLFAWYSGGDKEFPSALPTVQYSLTEADHRYLKGYVDRTGALVVGRRLFNITNGWDGTHPFDLPVVVVTHNVPEDWVGDHPDAPFTFITDGIESAIQNAKEIANGKDVGITAGKLASQAVELGLIDEVYFDLVPVMLGSGTRYFEELSSGALLLDGPEIIEGSRVTHLRYTVRRS